MKRFLCLSLLFIACKEIKKDKAVDDLRSLEIKQRAAEMTDSLIKGAQEHALFSDTLGISSSPVKVISARPVKEEYSSYKDISVTYKNVSGKNISAIRFKWYGINAFNEPAEMGGMDGFGSGFTDSKLRAGKSETSEWSILSKDLKKVIKAWAYEVVFEDGSKWTPLKP